MRTWWNHSGSIIYPEHDVTTMSSQYRVMSQRKCSLGFIQSCGKGSKPHDSKACRTTFSSNSLKSLFSVWLCVAGLYFGSFFFTIFLQLFEDCKHLFIYSSLKVLHRISVKLRSALWLGHCNTLILLLFRHSVEDFLVCLGSFSSCLTLFWPSFTVRQMSYLTLKYYRGADGQWWQDSLQNKLKLSRLHHHAW